MIQVSVVEVKDVELPQTMQRAMARQAEAERDKRAKVIHAEGDRQASELLADAARAMSTEPGALQLRFLQTLSEIGVEHNSTIIFPLPIELFSGMVDAHYKPSGNGGSGSSISTNGTGATDTSSSPSSDTNSSEE